MGIRGRAGENLSPGLRTRSVSRNRGREASVTWRLVCATGTDHVAEGTEWAFLSFIPHLSPSCSGVERKADTCGLRDRAGG